MQPTGESPRVPARAVVMSVAALAVPVTVVLWFPDWSSSDGGTLVWLTALVPAFLLAYYRGMEGVAIALSGGMAVITATQVSLVAFQIADPAWGLLAGVVGVYLGVSVGIGLLADALRRERSRAEEMAFTDRLTGIANRRRIQDLLAREFQAAQRGRTLSVVLFDLDHFKRVNDVHGHAVGDATLQAFANLLRETTRAKDLSGRFGGEEFLSVLSDCSAEQAREFAQRVLDRARDLPLVSGPQTASAGVAQYQPGMGSYEVLLGEADRLLYRAKREGRDRVCTEPQPAKVAGTAPLPTVAAASAWVPAPGRRARLWIVDDDDRVRRLLVEMLHDEGFDIWDSGDATEVVRQFAAVAPSERPDALLVDVIMPIMTGMRMVEQLTAVSPALRVIYMSGHVSGTIDWQGPPTAVVAFLAKPIPRTELLSTLQHVLQRSTGVGSGGTGAVRVPGRSGVA